MPKVSDIYFSFTHRGSHLLLIYSTPDSGIYFSFTLKGSDCLFFYFSLCFYELTREIITTGRLSDASYGSGVANFGNEIMIELIGICGYYTLISFTLNVFKVPLPEGESSPFYR